MVHVIHLHVSISHFSSHFNIVYISYFLYLGDASSPHGANCVQFNGGDGSKPSSPSSPAGAGNEGLTRQQLDLISQIMQQTKQANAGLTATSGHKPVQRPRTWNMQVSGNILYIGVLTICVIAFRFKYRKRPNLLALRLMWYSVMYRVSIYFLLPYHPLGTLGMASIKHHFHHQENDGKCCNQRTVIAFVNLLI